ncbi:MAG: hypothetical protein NT150_15240 [Bacteroidetes bacterium]|nr:hypothetical protein [Bacteroidota bacterium]
MEAVEVKEKSSVQGLRIGLYLLLNIAGYIVWSQHLLSPLGVEILYVVLFSASMIFEFRVKEDRFFALPPAFFSLYAYIQIIWSGYFFMEYGLGEWIYFDGDPDIVNRTSIYTYLATCVLWISFYLFPGFKVDLFKKINFVGVSRNVVFGMVALSLISLIVGIELGVYGYQAKEDGSAVIFYIRYFVDLGWLAIIFILIYYYDDKRYRRLMYMLVIIYFFAGIAFGSKSTAVAPILLFAVGLYMTGRKIKLAFIIGAALTVVVAFTVIEPFRMYYQFIGDKYDTSNPADLVRMYREAYLLSQQLEDDEKADMALMLASRQNNIAALGLTLQYAEKYNYYATDEYKHLLLSPLYAFVPRFIWSSKPLADIGHWASVNIYGGSDENSIGITPQGYAYLIGREWGIIFIFFIYGMMQRLIFSTFYANKKFLPLYILMYFSVGYPSELPWANVAGTLKQAVVLLPAIYLFAIKVKIAEK